MNDKKIILASQSPRRIEILKDLKINFETKPSQCRELSFKESQMTPTEFAIANAERKARDIAQNESNALVIGMDTIGEYENQVIEKPRDQEHAKEMINLLNSTSHNVITGICIIDADSEDKVAAAETTKVKFTTMSDNEIEAYLDTGDWEGLACGYGIQGLGALFIEKIEGDYFNVVGFPVFRFYHLMKQIGVNVLELRK
ncbi:Maf family protein [Patescibacteria group bacterium]